MEIAVRFSGNLRLLAGKKELIARVEDGFTLRQFLLYLSDQIHPDFNTAILKPLLEEANPAPLTLIMLNRRHNQSLEVLDTQLHDGDQLSFLPPMEGGQ
jgi:molybdopterin converting factor small subunit